MRINFVKATHASSDSLRHEEANESKHDKIRVVNSSDATLKMSLGGTFEAISTSACNVGRSICILALFVIVAIDLRRAVCTVSDESALIWERR